MSIRGVFVLLSSVRALPGPQEDKKEALDVCNELFHKYTDRSLLGHGHPKLVGSIGFMRVVRDCALLDNRFGYGTAKFSLLAFSILIDYLSF